GYTGSTQVAAGSGLVLAGAGSIAASSVVHNDGTLDIAATAAGAAVRSLAGTGTVALGDRTLTLTQAGDTFTGSIGGAGGLEVTGGMQTLSGSNTYRGGTTLAGGGV